AGRRRGRRMGRRLARLSESDVDHFRNIVGAVLDGLLPRLAPPIAAAVVAHYEGTAIADSPLSDAVPSEPLIRAAERIVAAVDQEAGDDAMTRLECLEIVREMAEARVTQPPPVE